MPPWNAEQVFEPAPLPQLTQRALRPKVAPQDTPVRNRYWPAYQPRGIRYGDWMFDPQVMVGSLYDSNVYASPTEIEGDVAGTVAAQVRAHSLWLRNGIDVQASVRHLFYGRHTGLNETDAKLKGNARLDIDHATALLTGFEAAYLHEGVGTLSSPSGAVEPTPYSYLSDDVTLRHEFGRLTGSVGGRIDNYDFGSVKARDGSTINQDARDGQVYTLHGRLDYAFSPKLGMFTAVAGNARRLRGTATQSLSSTGYRLLTGVDVELTPLIKAELAGGYMAQRFDAASIGTIEGPAYRARVTWSPSRRLDLHFNAEQIVGESSNTSTTGILANALQAGFDYEFRPNIVLSTAGGYERDSFKGEDRSDDVYSVDTQLRYVLNRINSISLTYKFSRRQSNIGEFSYDKHQVGINAAARF